MPSRGDITVAIPYHAARVRNGMLDRAVNSVLAQTWRPAAVSLAEDIWKQGAPATRQRALDTVQTTWVAFLDSDDYFLPLHLELLADHAIKTGADYVYSYWDTSITPDILGHFGKPFDPKNPTETTITILARTGLVKEIGFKALEDRAHNTGEDWRLVNGMIKLGAHISHLPEMTWVWSHHSGNTSGMPSKGDALESGPRDRLGRRMCTCPDYNLDGAAFEHIDGYLEAFCSGCGLPTGKEWRASQA